MCRLLAETFTRNDPPAVALELPSDEFEEFVGLYSSSASMGLTILARDASTHEMAGVLLTEDITSPAVNIEQVSKKFDPIFGLLGELDTSYRQEKVFRPGEWLHLFLLGVSDRYGRRGIGQRLVEACIENGAAKGYKFAVTEATNRVSQHIFRKLGFVERAYVAYADYRHQGAPVFASVSEHGGPMVMDRQLEAID
ncbi:MAG TPA: GNAT family N-acetyltransferase [Acidimicrobiia bacterium]|nr:GNAT family N-acetyltransferase [Acidimicrobiia bacterium]